MMVAERGGDTMVPRIAMMKALHHREPESWTTPRHADDALRPTALSGSVARRPREPRTLDEPRAPSGGRPERSAQATLRGRAPPFRGEDEGPHSLCDIAEEEPKLVTLRRSADRSQPTIWAGRNK
jgi:hypothetical protein